MDKYQITCMNDHANNYYNDMLHFLADNLLLPLAK